MIAIIGNLASGKSTLAKLIHQQLDHYTYLSIDEFRVRFQAHTKRGEANAWQALAIAAHKSENIIFESSGTANHFPEVIEKFKKKGGKVLVVQLECSVHECLIRRRQQLKSGYIPPPFPYKTNIATSISVIHTRLASAKADLIFNSETHTPEQIFGFLSKNPFSNP